jgi:predicted transcriptional regulator
MDKPVRQHIKDLEARVQFLGLQLMDGQKPQAERNGIESELRVAQQALDYYRAALELEGKLQHGARTSIAKKGAAD